MSKKRLIRTVAGMGLSAGLFLGCQDFMGQKSDSGGSAIDRSSALMQLDIKDSAACLNLHDRCLWSHHEGLDSSVLDTLLVKNCIVDTAQANRISMGMFDGRGHERGRHGRHWGFFHGPRLDSTAALALCDSLTQALAKADSTDSNYSALKYHAAKACNEHFWSGPRPALDSTAAKALCDSINTVLAATDSTSADYIFIKHESWAACRELGRPPHRDHGRRHHGHGWF